MYMSSGAEAKLYCYVTLVKVDFFRVHRLYNTRGGITVTIIFRDLIIRIIPFYRVMSC